MKPSPTARTGGTGLKRTEANPEDVRATNVLAKLGWNYTDDSRLGLTYEKYKDDRDTNQLSAVGGPFNAGRGFGFYKSRTGNDTVTRERFGLEHRFGLDSAAGRQHQVDPELPDRQDRPEHRRNLLRRSRYGAAQPRYHLQGSPMGIRCAGWTRRLPSPTPTTCHLRHHPQAGESHRSAHRQRHLPDRVGACRVIGAPSAADTLTPASDFPDPTINSYSLFAQDQISWGNWTFLPGAALRLHPTQAAHHRGVPQHRRPERQRRR